MVLTGCKDDESDEAPSVPEIRFEVSGVDVGAEGGVQTLAYEIAGDKEPGTLEARVDETVGWVHSFDTSEAGCCVSRWMPTIRRPSARPWSM